MDIRKKIYTAAAILLIGPQPYFYADNAKNTKQGPARDILDTEKEMWDLKKETVKKEQEEKKKNEIFESMARLYIEQEKTEEFAKYEKELVKENEEVDKEFDKLEEKTTSTVADTKSRKIFGASVSDLEKAGGNVQAAKLAVPQTKSIFNFWQ